MDFEKLYRSYYMQVYSYTVALMRNRERAEEITQNAFFRAVSTKAAFRRDSDELTWLCSIAKNLYMDELRRMGRFSDLSETEAATGYDIEAHVADADEAFRIHLILHGLDEPYKEVFGLRVFGELSYAQIGRIFGKSENWARVTYHRAKLKIWERMDAKNE